MGTLDGKRSTGIILLFPMKLLILPYPENIALGKKRIPRNPHPHLFTDIHVKKIEGTEKKGKLQVLIATNEKEAIACLPHVDIIAGFPRTIPPLANAKKLKWLHSFSAGVDRILTPETKQLPILVSNSSGIHKTPIAEHVIGFMLIFTRKFLSSFRNQEQRVWEKNPQVSELKEKTVLVVGLGEIGSEVARLSHAFGARVLALTRTKKVKPHFIEKLATSDMLHTVLGKADFVVVCLPYTSKTHHFFGMREFKCMKPSAVLINIGRGAIANEKELIEALKKRIIAGAALDVTETEPLPIKSSLWGIQNVIITPHHSGWSEKYMDRAIDLFCDNLKAFLAGKELPNLVDKIRGY